MGCGLSKSSDSDSPSQKRRKGSKGKNSIGTSSDGCSESVSRVEVAADGKKNKLRTAAPPTPVLNQTKVLSASQLEFFRQLDQKIEEGQDLDIEKAEKEKQTRMTLLKQHWDEVIHSRPGTNRPRPDSLTASLSSTLLANGTGARGAALPAAAEGSEDGQQATRTERNVRSSRRSMRSARADSLETDGAVTGGGTTVTGTPSGTALDDSQLVTKLIQLGDAYVHDLDAGDPDSFVRLGRRSSNYEEPVIVEEAEAAANARGQYGRSSLALRTMLDDRVH